MLENPDSTAKSSLEENLAKVNPDIRGDLAIIVDYNATHKPGMSINDLRSHSEAVKEMDAWMEVSLPRHMNRKVMVAFSQRAHLACLKRYGALGVIVINWDEFKACAQGVAEVTSPVEQALRMKQALWFFAQRQNIFIDD